MDDHLLKLKTYLSSLIRLDDASFDEFATHAQLLEVKKGERILEAGKRSENLYFISEGLFRIYHLKNDTEVNTCFCGENEITCSFESFANHTVTRDFIEAIEDSIVLTISRDALFKLIQKNPIWDELRQILTDQECIRLSNRVDTLSFSTAQEKYESMMKSQKQFIQRIPIQYLASYLGISRETLSRVRSKTAHI